MNRVLAPAFARGDMFLAPSRGRCAGRVACILPRIKRPGRKSNLLSTEQKNGAPSQHASEHVSTSERMCIRCSSFSLPEQAFIGVPLARRTIHAGRTGTLVVG